jgi:2-hydroxychromene-2-carboxylate isomerase
MAEIDFHFDFRSPYSFLAFAQLPGLEATVNLRPMDVLAVMDIVGNVPTTIVCKAKNRYAFADLGRWSARLGVPLLPNPAMSAADGRLLLRAALAANGEGLGWQATELLFKAMWQTPSDLDAAGIEALFNGAGLPGGHLRALAESDATGAALDAASRAAASRAAADLGVFGAPTIAIGGDLYFGNDRLDFVRERLAADAMAGVA